MTIGGVVHGRLTPELPNLGGRQKKVRDDNILTRGLHSKVLSNGLRKAV